MEISLTVSYKMEIDKDDFWDTETGKIKAEVKKQLEKMFPKELELSEDGHAIRKHISYVPLKEGKNCLKCASCGASLYIPGKEYLADGLEYCKMIKNVPFCNSCAWELKDEL